MISRSQEVETFPFLLSEVYNFNTDKIEAADYHLKNSDEGYIVRLRTALEAEDKRYGCPICKTKIGIRHSSKGNWYFAHKPKPDHVKCYLSDASTMTEQQVRMQRYYHNKESEKHKTLKNNMFNYQQYFF